ncbi:hypothetical protein ACIGG9_29225 [Pseudonocardia alni]|uniref:hypothetical protein n=1 Tax=Pseudonocardia alni TaxID=33907 RepID=UPI0037C87363
MCVDQSRENQVSGRVDDLGVDDVQRRGHGGDHPVLDQDVTAVDVADGGIHRQDAAASDHDACHRTSVAPDRGITMYRRGCDALARAAYHRARHEVVRTRTSARSDTL